MKFESVVEMPHQESMPGSSTGENIEMTASLDQQQSKVHAGYVYIGERAYTYILGAYLQKVVLIIIKIC